MTKAKTDIQTQIESFLQSDTPEVFAIRGKWGVGKTYAWQTYYAQAKENKLKYYAYVSLFGIDSIDTLKLTIYTKAYGVGALESLKSSA